MALYDKISTATGIIKVGKTLLMEQRRALLYRIRNGDYAQIEATIPHCFGLNWHFPASPFSGCPNLGHPIQELLRSPLVEPLAKQQILHLLLANGANPLFKCKALPLKRLSPPRRPSPPLAPDYRLASMFALVDNPAQRQLVRASRRFGEQSSGTEIHAPLFFDEHSFGYLWMMQKFCKTNLFNNEVDWYKCTLLHYAVLGEDQVLVRNLLELGADPTKQNIWKETPLDIAFPEMRQFILTLSAKQELASALPVANLAPANNSNDLSIGHPDFSSSPRTPRL